MINSNQQNSGSKSATANLTALWAFSEGFLGGILNVLRIPFKGLALGSMSVIVITLIAGISDKKGIIFRSGIIVMIVKAIISPYSSIPAYFAVFVQTILGELFFLNRKFPSISAISLGIVTSAISSIQRIVVLTLLFGNAFWETVDQFTNYVYNEFLGGNSLPPGFRFSNWLIGIYVAIHCLVGLMTGLYAARLSRRLKKTEIGNGLTENNIFKNFVKQDVIRNKQKSGKKKFKITKILVYIFLIVVLILTYITGDRFIDPKSVWAMLIRSVMIMIIWFKIVSPFLQKILRKHLLKSRHKYSAAIEHTVDILPLIKTIFIFSWKKQSAKNYFRRIFLFIDNFFLILMNYDFSKGELAEPVNGDEVLNDKNTAVAE